MMESIKGTAVLSAENLLRPKKTQDGLRTIQPIAAVSPQAVTPGRLYRMVSTSPINFYLSKEATPAAATSSDILIPANQSTIIDTEGFDKLVFVGGALQIVEVMG